MNDLGKIIHEIEKSKNLWERKILQFINFGENSVKDIFLKFFFSFKYNIISDEYFFLYL